MFSKENRPHCEKMRGKNITCVRRPIGKVATDFFSQIIVYYKVFHFVNTESQHFRLVFLFVL